MYRTDEVSVQNNVKGDIHYALRNESVDIGSRTHKKKNKKKNKKKKKVSYSFAWLFVCSGLISLSAIFQLYHNCV